MKMGEWLMPSAVTIWRFPKVGVKPSHPFFHTFFLYKPCSLGYHHFWKPPYLCHLSYQGGRGQGHRRICPAGPGQCVEGAWGCSTNQKLNPLGKWFIDIWWLDNIDFVMLRMNMHEQCLHLSLSHLEHRPTEKVINNPGVSWNNPCRLSHEWMSGVTAATSHLRSVGWSSKYQLRKTPHPPSQLVSSKTGVL